MTQVRDGPDALVTRCPQAAAGWTSSSPFATSRTFEKFMTHGVLALLRQPDATLKLDAQCWLLHFPQAVPGEQLSVIAMSKNSGWEDRKLSVEALASYKAQRFGNQLRHSRLELDKDSATSLAERLNEIVPPHRLQSPLR